MLKDLGINLNVLRIRRFEYGGNTFRVLMPLAGELTLIMQRIDTPEESTFKLIRADQKKDADGELVLKAAKTAQYILESWNLLCNEAGEKKQVTYEELQAEIPFAIQVEVSKRVIDLLQPDWSEDKKN